MAEFIKVGSRRISLESVRAVDDDGPDVIVHYAGGVPPERFTNANADAFRAWADGKVTATAKPKVEQAS